MFPKQQGSMLVIAIFILTAMMLLGLSLSKILMASHNSVSVEVLGTRAFLAAQSGAEIGIAQLLPAADPDNPIINDCKDVELTPTLPQTTGFANCHVSLTCNRKIILYEEDDESDGDGEEDDRDENRSKFMGKNRDAHDDHNENDDDHEDDDGENEGNEDDENLVQITHFLITSTASCGEEQCNNLDDCAQVQRIVRYDSVVSE